MRTGCGRIVLTLRPATKKLEQAASKPRYNTVAIVTDLRGRAIADIFRCLGLQDKQQSTFENQLRAFIERRREPHMAMVMSKVHGVSPALQTALAAHFNALNPPPFGGAAKQLAGEGKDIYEQGVPDDNVPACQVCHGPDAKGTGPIPRLAGQLYPYTVKELVNWDKERGQGANSDYIRGYAADCAQFEQSAG